MKLYARRNATDCEILDIFYIHNKINYMFANPCASELEMDLWDALMESEEEGRDLELELKPR